MSFEDVLCRHVVVLPLRRAVVRYLPKRRTLELFSLILCIWDTSELVQDLLMVLRYKLSPQWRVITLKLCPGKLQPIVRWPSARYA